jgi:hypothetical protein
MGTPVLPDSSHCYADAGTYPAIHHCHSYSDQRIRCISGHTTVENWPCFEFHNSSLDTVQHFRALKVHIRKKNVKEKCFFHKFISAKKKKKNETVGFPKL